MAGEELHTLSRVPAHTPTAVDEPVKLTDWAGGFPSSGETFDPIPASEDECLRWFQPLLAAMVRKYAHQPHPVLSPEDVLQEASIGLIQAYRKFDPTRGVFAAFAQQCVFSAVMDLLRRADPLSTHHRHKLRALPDWFAETARTRQPTDAEFTLACTHISLSPREVRALLSATRIIEIPVHIAPNEELLDTLGHPHQHAENPEMSVDLRDAAQRCMGAWKDRDRRIFIEAVIMGRKQSELAQEMGLTQARISQIASRCWTDIFTALRDHL